MELTALIRFEEGAYWAEVKELPGCFASGASLDELQEALAESVTLCLSEDSNSNESDAPSIRVEELKLLVVT